MDEDVVAAGQRAPGLVASESRVVREPGRWSRLIALVVVVAVVAGGLLWWVGAGSPIDDDGGEEPRAGSSRDGRPTRVAFYQAVTRLVQFGSFAYSGDVHAVGQSAFRPGDGMALDVSVEGAVLLDAGLTREVAVDSMGRAVETVTSGPSVWTRSAATAEGLGAEPWEVRLHGSSSLGTAAIALLVASARDPREELPDADGRRVIRATLPPADQPDGDGDLLAGADLVVTLDEDGNVARMIVSSTPVDPKLRLELDITGLGEPQAIAPPDDGETGLRRTIPVEELEAAGVRPVELGRLPSGWTLTRAQVVSGQPVPSECPRLLLFYRDPDAVSRDSLRLTVTSTTCRWTQLGHGEPQPLTVGSFQGLVVEAGSDVSGDLTNGTTRVFFLTDLSVEDAATVLGSLRPFDPDTEPAPIPGIPST